jgi:hypothetical protein
MTIDELRRLEQSELANVNFIKLLSIALTVG